MGRARQQHSREAVVLGQGRDAVAQKVGDVSVDGGELGHTVRCTVIRGPPTVIENETR